ncbi:MAG: hypothetical protein ABI333_21320 [bacterium]
MTNAGSEKALLFRKVAWVAAGVCGFGVFVGAVLLAIEAQSVERPQKLSAKAPPRRTPRRTPTRVEPMTPKVNLPPVTERKATTAAPPATIRDRRATGLTRPDLARTKLHGINAVMRPEYAGRKPNRLSKEELEKRRDERRGRQVERLRKRIQTLVDRISNYKQDGTRTEAQITRMERSLERMRERLKRMEEEEKKP